MVEIGVDFPHISQDFEFLSKIFLRLVKTIIAPILFSTLVVGIATHSNLRQVGRMGWKSLLYFEIVTTAALIIGLVSINITKAGEGIIIPDTLLSELPQSKERELQGSVIEILNKSGLDIPEDILNQLPDAPKKTWQQHIINIFPENFIKSIYEGNVLPIVVFSIIFGISLAQLQTMQRNLCSILQKASLKPCLNSLISSSTLLPLVLVQRFV